MSSPADLFARRVAYLRAGGEPNARERRWAAIFDLSVLYGVDARELTTQQLALAMLASRVLGRQPEYVHAVKEARRERDKRTEVDAIFARIDAGDRVGREAVRAAYAAVERRQAAAHDRAAAIAMRSVRPAGRVLPCPRCAGGRPRSRRPRTRAQARAPSGDDGPEGEGDGDSPPPALLRALRLVGRRASAGSLASPLWRLCVRGRRLRARGSGRGRRRDRLPDCRSEAEEA